jgi:hypothetical protein
MTYEEYLAVPYLLVMESVEKPDGDWVRRASHPELPGCEVEADHPIEALDKLEELRRQLILDMMARGEKVPVPRPPLRTPVMEINKDRLDFAKWLVQSGRVTDA